MRIGRIGREIAFGGRVHYQRKRAIGIRKRGAIAGPQGHRGVVRQMRRTQAKRFRIARQTAPPKCPATGGGWPEQTLRQPGADKPGAASQEKALAAHGAATTPRCETGHGPDRAQRFSMAALSRDLCRLGNRVEAFQDVVQHGRREAGVDADPEDLVHDEVGVDERRRNAIVAHSGTPAGAAGCRRTAGACRSCAAPVRWITLVARERRVGTHRDGEAEPARIRARRGFGQDEELLQIAQAFAQAVRNCGGEPR